MADLGEFKDLIAAAYVPSLDAVPEDRKPLYAPNADGTFRLDGLEDISGLKKALQSERKLKSDFERQFTSLKADIGDMDGTKLAALRTELEDLRNKKDISDEGFKEAVAKKTQAMVDDHKRQLEAKEKELADSTLRAGEADRRWRKDKIHRELTDAAVVHGVQKSALGDVRRLGEGIWDVDEHERVVFRQNGELKYGKNGVDPLTPREWLDILKADPEGPSHWWPPSSGSGAVNAGRGPNGVDLTGKSPQDKLKIARRI